MLARWFTSSVFMLVLSGCMRIDLDESTVFTPPDVSYTSDSAEGLKLQGEEDFVEEINANIGIAPSTVSHGFIALENERIAWTKIDRVGENRPFVVHCGGGATDRYSDGLSYATKVLPYGNVLIFDYPGYGDSTGEPNTQSMEAMQDGLPAFIRDQLGEDQALVLWGHSLGGFVCSQFVKNLPETDAMIIETSALNVDEIADAWTPWYAKPFVRTNPSVSLRAYDNAAALSEFEGPVLVLGAGQDDSLPVKLSRSLAEALKVAGRQVQYVEFANADHHNVSQQDEFGSIMDRFFMSIEP